MEIFVLEKKTRINNHKNNINIIKELKKTIKIEKKQNKINDYGSLIQILSELNKINRIENLNDLINKFQERNIFNKEIREGINKLIIEKGIKNIDNLIVEINLLIQELDGKQYEIKLVKFYIELFIKCIDNINKIEYFTKDPEKIKKKIIFDYYISNQKKILSNIHQYIENENLEYNLGLNNDNISILSKLITESFIEINENNFTTKQVMQKKLKILKQVKSISENNLKMLFLNSINYIEKKIINDF